MKNKKKMSQYRVYPNCKTMLYERNIRNFISALIGVGFKTVATLGFSVFTQKILDTISGQENSTVIYLTIFALACVGCLVIGAILEYIFWTAFRSQALFKYREYIYRKIFNKDIATFCKENSATYTSAISNDLNQIKNNYIEALPYAAELIFNFIGTVVLMFYFDVKMALIAIPVSLLPVLLSSFQMKQIEECEEKMAEANSHFLGEFTEAIKGFQSVKSMKAENSVANKLCMVNRLAADAFTNREHVEIAVAYIASLIGHLAQLIFFFAAMMLARSGEGISVGMIIVFIQLMQHISQLGITMPELIANIKASQKLMENHDQFLSKHQTYGRKNVVSCHDKIQMKHVSAGFATAENVLKDITINFSANGCYAIIGESGSGKTTLINLLAGFNRNYYGDICYDGLNIRDISTESLFDLISVIQQDIFIFNATIRDNITMFRDYPEDELTEAVHKAGLCELVNEKGLDYICGENGNMLSGGERQRIGIARSILKRNNVLLLDEATSSLDSQTGYQIIDTVQKMRDKTRIVVTHDIYPELMNSFDCIFVLKDGQVAESGTFSELLVRKNVGWSLTNKTINDEAKVFSCTENK